MVDKISTNKKKIQIILKKKYNNEIYKSHNYE